MVAGKARHATAVTAKLITGKVHDVVNKVKEGRDTVVNAYNKEVELKDLSDVKSLMVLEEGGNIEADNKLTQIRKNLI